MISSLFFNSVSNKFNLSWVAFNSVLNLPFSKSFSKAFKRLFCSSFEILIF